MTSNGNETNNNRYYILDKGVSGGSLSLAALSATEQNTVTLYSSERYKLITIFDFSNSNVDVKIRFGLEVTQLECSMRFDYEGGFTQYEEDGGGTKFKTDLASALGISENYLNIGNMYEGSVVVEYTLQTDENS